MKELEADTLTPPAEAVHQHHQFWQLFSAGVALSCSESLSGGSAQPGQVQHRWKKAISKAQEGTQSAYQKFKEILSKSEQVVLAWRRQGHLRCVQGALVDGLNREHTDCRESRSPAVLQCLWEGGIHQRIKQSSRPRHGFGTKVTPV